MEFSLERDGRRLRTEAAVRRGSAIGLALVSLGLSNTIAWAQAASSASPPTREEIQRADQLSRPQSRANVSVEGDIERAACPLSAPQYAAITINFAGVSFNGLKVVDAAALQDTWSDKAGHDVPIAALCDIRDRAATALRAMGYLAAVQVPPQRIEKGGTVSFDVLMAKLVGIQVRGDAGNSERLIAAQLQALQDAPAFNVHDAERNLLLARDLPGYDVRLSLRPAGGAPGEVIAEVSVVRQRVRLDANIQNLGSNAVGRWGGLARLQINDLTGMGDSTVVSLFNTAQTREQSVLQLSHSMALNADGLRLSGDFTYAWSKPDILNGTIKSDTLISSLALSYPLVRSQARNLLLTGGLEWIDQKVRFGGLPLTADHLRVFFARIDAGMIDRASMSSTAGYSANEPRWRLSGSLEVRQGISGLGASAGPAAGLSRADGDPSAFVLRASTTAEWRPVPKLTFALSPRAQYSAHALLSFEEFSAGNYTVGRGYDAGSITGDRGLGFSAEARLGSLIPASPQDLALQPFAFLDAAWAWNEAQGHEKLYSAGGGVRGAWGNRARFDLTLAKRLRDVPTEPKGDVRLLFSLTTQILPWRP